MRLEHFIATWKSFDFIYNFIWIPKVKWNWKSDKIFPMSSYGIEEGSNKKRQKKMKSLVRFSIYFPIRPHFSVHYTGNLLTVVFVMYTNLSDSKASVSDVLFILWFYFAIFCWEWDEMFLWMYAFKALWEKSLRLCVWNFLIFWVMPL